MKIQKISPCPADCGHKPKLIHDVANNPVQVWHVECACGWKGPFETSEAEAIKAWNKPPRLSKLMPLDAWDEDLGDVLWWVLPITEPPYCGTPLDADWPGYHTHFTTFESPEISDDESERLVNAE